MNQFGKTGKNGNTKKEKSKGKLDSSRMKDLEEQLQSHNQEKSSEPVQARKRLRKQNPVESDEDSILIKLQESDSDEQYSPMQEEKDYQFEKYQYKDDQQIQQDQKRKQEAKQSKKGPKNNTKMTQFMDQQKQNPKKPAKTKQKKATTQMNLAQSFNHIKKRKRKESDDFICSDNDSQDSQAIAKARIAAKATRYQPQQKFQKEINGDLTEKECLQIAMKLSLQQKQMPKNKYQDIDAYAAFAQDYKDNNKKEKQDVNNKINQKQKPVDHKKPLRTQKEIQKKPEKVQNRQVAKTMASKENQQIIPNRIEQKKNLNMDQQKMVERKQKKQVLLPWTQKHKPKAISDIMGQSSQIKSLRAWLEHWQQNFLHENQQKNKSGQQKAALLSGDPGLGKTTTARLLAAQFHYDVVQFNASDVRNKNSIMQIQSSGFGLGMAHNLQKTLIIMDEIDGMSGGDRGGTTGIINMIKTSKSPIICICNDKQNQKLKSVINYCLDIKFHKPDKRIIVKRIMQILRKENAKAEDEAIQKIVQIFQNDIRKILSYLQVFVRTKSKNITIKDVTGDKVQTKQSTVMSNIFESSRKLMNKSSMTLRDKLDCFFIDSFVMPGMIHENYLSSASKSKMTAKEFHKIVQANKAFCLGDVLSRKISKQQAYKLMPSQGMMSCVYPCEKVSVALGFPQFASFLGKNSAQTKTRRLVKQLKYAISPLATVGNFSTVFPYAQALITQIHDGLKDQNINGVIDFMEMYNLNPLLLSENLDRLYYNPNKISIMADIDSKIKAKLTRQFNKRHQETKMKLTKGKKGEVNLLKYDPQMEQVQVDDMIEQEEEQSEEGPQFVVKEKATKGKKKK